MHWRQAERAVITAVAAVAIALPFGLVGWWLFALGRAPLNPRLLIFSGLLLAFTGPQSLYWLPCCFDTKSFAYRRDSRKPLLVDWDCGYQCVLWKQTLSPQVLTKQRFLRPKPHSSRLATALGPRPSPLAVVLLPLAEELARMRSLLTGAAILVGLAS
jgi:hypothetical protein